MRLAHKRKVQKKLQKYIRTLKVNVTCDESQVEPKLKAVVIESPVIEISLTPKQQHVFDIVARFSGGINSKSIGLEAGQDDSKAASWATGALKKLLEENLVEKMQLSGNKVIYKVR